MADYGSVTLTARRAAEAESYVLCPECFGKLRRFLWGGDTEDEVRAMPAEDQEGGAGEGALAAAGRDDHGPGAGMGDADLPRMRGEDTGFYLQEGDR